MTPKATTPNMRASAASKTMLPSVCSAQSLTPARRPSTTLLTVGSWGVLLWLQRLAGCCYGRYASNVGGETAAVAHTQSIHGGGVLVVDCMSLRALV